jgi:hypothetical protein
MSTPQPICSGNEPLRGNYSNRLRRLSIHLPCLHPTPPSTFGRVSTSSHTLTTWSSRQPDLWTTPPLKCHKAALHALAVTAAGPALGVGCGPRPHMVEGGHTVCRRDECAGTAAIRPGDAHMQGTPEIEEPLSEQSGEI